MYIDVDIEKSFFPLYIYFFVKILTLATIFDDYISTNPFIQEWVTWSYLIIITLYYKIQKKFFV